MDINSREVKVFILFYIGFFSAPQCRVSTYIWLLLGYPVVAVVHSLACVLSWLLVFTIPVAKMNARTLHTILLMAPEDIQVRKLEKVLNERQWSVALKSPKAAKKAWLLLFQTRCETQVLLCCYRALNVYYYKYTVHGINIFALSILSFWGLGSKNIFHQSAKALVSSLFP